MNKLHIISLSLFFCLIFKFDAFSQIPQPEDGKGLVVFYRQKKFSGGAIKFSVKDTEKNYGQLTNGSVINISVDPGEHTFFSQVISSDAITVKVEEGNVYYVKATVKTGAIAGRPKFKQVEEKTAHKDMKLK